MVYSQGCSTSLEVTKIGVFGLIYVSLVQVIGQARWSIPKGFAFGKVVFENVLPGARVKDTTPCKSGG